MSASAARHKTPTLQAPFPWFGGKSRAASLVWSRFGDVGNYVEPFFGSGAVLLGRPHRAAIETVNDKDGFVSNFWRAVKAAPEDVATWADQPVNEADMHARHAYLVGIRDALCGRLMGDPDYFDAKVAGWWCWGVCCWIGSGWCSGNGPWHSVEMANGYRQLVHLGDAGQGVNRQLVHLGDAGQGVVEWMGALASRLARVRVCCGDWLRICGDAPTVAQGLTGVLLDPPYSAEASRGDRLYAKDSLSVAHDVRDWAIQRGDNPLLRIALCGYEGEHQMPAGWECVAWKANGGYGLQGKGRARANAARERIWFSPHCLAADGETAESLFADAADEGRA